MKSEGLIPSFRTKAGLVRYILTYSLRMRKNRANRNSELEVMDFLVTGARKANPERSSHFKGIITLAILLLKFGKYYMRKQRSSNTLPRRIHVKRIKI